MEQQDSGNVAATGSSHSQAGKKPTRGSGRKRSKPVKATPMSTDEMAEMVRILRSHDYDGHREVYEHPNERKDEILDNVIRRISRKFGVVRSKDQLRKRWSDLKHREQDRLRSIDRMLKKRERERREAAEEGRAAPGKMAAGPSHTVTSQEQQDEAQAEVLSIPDEVVTIPDEEVPGGSATTPPPAAAPSSPMDSRTAHVIIAEMMRCDRELEDMEVRVIDVAHRMKALRRNVSNCMDMLHRF